MSRRNPSHFLPPMSMRPRRILVDMPIHVKEAIVNHADIKTRISLRRCNHELRNLVDTLPIVYDSIELWQEHVRIYEEDTVAKNWVMKVTKGDDKVYRERSVEENQEWLLKGLEAILKNPKAQFVHLDTSNFDLLKLQPILSSLNHKLSVKELRIGKPLDQNNALSLLPYLKPEVLESFKGGEVSSDCLPNLLHLQLQNVEIGMMELTEEDVSMLVESSLKMGSEFRRWHIWRTRESDTPVMRHFDIPNSEHKLEMIHFKELFCLQNMEYVEERFR